MREKSGGALRYDDKAIRVQSSDVADTAALMARIARDAPWALTESLVCKPDQLIKRRGKLGLVGAQPHPESRPWRGSRSAPTSP